MDNKWGVIIRKGQFIKGKIIGELIRVEQNGNISYMHKNLKWIYNK